MKAIRISLMAVLALALGACNIFIYDGAPAVALYAPKTVLNSGEVVLLEADVTGGKAPFAYAWEEDGVSLNDDSSEYAYSRFVTSSRDVTLKLIVTDAEGRSTSVSKVVTVVRPSTSAAIRIINDSNYDAYYLYVSPASNGNWGPDQLRPNIVIYKYGGTWDLTGVPAGDWDLKMVSINSTYSWTLLNQHVSAPGTYTWTLRNFEWD